MSSARNRNLSEMDISMIERVLSNNINGINNQAVIRLEKEVYSVNDIPSSQ